MFFITFAIILSICQMVKCNWIQIAQASKEYLAPKNNMVIDRSHFLSTLNHNGDFFVKMENPKMKINTVNPFHVLTNQFESETNFFEYSTESTKTDNVTMSASNFTNIADWPDTIRSKNRKFNRVNFELESTTTVSPFSNITELTELANDSDIEISKTKSIYKDQTEHQSPHNEKAAVTQKRFVFKRLKYKPFDFPSVLDFLKNIQKSFLSRGFSAIEDKVKFLENFKDTIMNNIDRHFRAVWSVDQDRQKRSARHGHGGGGIEFPSSATALMTISFLTLAVFLIKLVLVSIGRIRLLNKISNQQIFFKKKQKNKIEKKFLFSIHFQQVIHTIKSKHYGMSSIHTATQIMETPIKIIKKNRNARKLSLSSTSMEDLRTMTETIESIESSSKAYT